MIGIPSGWLTLYVHIYILFTYMYIYTFVGDKDTEWFSVLIPEWFASVDRLGVGALDPDGATAEGSDVVGTQRSPLVNLGEVCMCIYIYIYIYICI